MQSDLLHPPIREVTNDELVRIPAVDGMNRAELPHLLARFAKPAQDPPVQLHLVDFTTFGKVLGEVEVRAVKVLVGSRSDAEGAGSANVQVLRLEVSIVVE